MANFNRGRQGGFRGPVEMHKAICDRCGKECEVPFRPTSGKPIYCSNCFESSKGPSSRRFDDRNTERSTNFAERPMFEAVCDECGNSCQVPFQPRGDKPIYCSNCFGDKKGTGNKENVKSQPQLKEQLEILNNKLDKILQVLNQKPREQVVTGEVEKEVVKKRSSKKITK